MYYIINSQTEYLLAMTETEDEARKLAESYALKQSNIPMIIAQRIAKVTDVVTKTTNLEWEV